jgi:hypothetical protein
VGQLCRRGLQSPHTLCPLEHIVMGGAMYSRHTGHSSTSIRPGAAGGSSTGSVSSPDMVLTGHVPPEN